MNGYLPAELIRPVVQRYLDSYEVGGTEDVKRSNQARFMSPTVRLSEEAQVGERWLRYLLSGETQNVEFNKADRLLCAMGLVWLWYAKPLSDHYWTIEVSASEKHDFEPIEPVTGGTFMCGHERTRENCKPDRKGETVVYWRCRTCSNARKRRMRRAAA